MKEQASNHAVDPLLLPLLRAQNESESQPLIEDLVTNHAAPIIKEIILHKLRSYKSSQNRHDGEDVQGNAVLKLLSYLRNFKRDPESRQIGDFRSYVAVIAYNACNEYLRQKYPLRNSLKNQLRYLFTHDPKLILRDDAGTLVCRLSEWKGQKQTAKPRLEALRCLGEAQPQGLADKPLFELVIVVLKLLDAPVALDDLVSLIAEVKGVKDVPEQVREEEGERPLEQLSDPRTRLDATVERRIQLERLWREICELPLRQRLALLLNLKDVDGKSQIEMFPFTGIATMRQIAGALEISDDDFARLWNDLPMEDAAIAARLNLTRQQVINLRKAARQRLAKRMKEAAF